MEVSEGGGNKLRGFKRHQVVKGASKDEYRVTTKGVHCKWTHPIFLHHRLVYIL